MHIYVCSRSSVKTILPHSIFNSSFNHAASLVKDWWQKALNPWPPAHEPAVQSTKSPPWTSGKMVRFSSTAIWFNCPLPDSNPGWQNGKSERFLCVASWIIVVDVQREKYNYEPKNRRRSTNHCSVVELQIKCLGENQKNHLWTFLK